MSGSCGRPEDLTDAALTHVRGGKVIIEARRRARGRLLQREGIDIGPRGRTGGWNGLGRGSSFESLAMSEYSHDDDELLRRHIDGEQLLLRRDESRSRPRCPLACVSLTASTLGTPRLVAAGIALALSEHARSHGVESPPVLVNATRSTTLSSLTELQALLDTPPAARAASVTAWRDAVAGRRGTWIATAAYLIAHEGDVAHTAEALFDGTFMLRGTAGDLRRGSEHTGAPR